MEPIDDFPITLQLMVDCTYRRGQRGDRTQPHELEGCEVFSVYAMMGDIKYRVNHLLSDADFERMEQILLEKKT